MLYADDTCTISSAGLQQLLIISSGYSKPNDLTLYICKFVKEVKYLCVIIMIHSSRKATIDIARQICKFYLQANLLLDIALSK